MWLFKGPIQTSSAMQVYGGSFGAASKGHAFPVSSARYLPRICPSFLSANLTPKQSRVHDAYSWKSKAISGSPVCQGTPCIVSSKVSPCVAKIATNGAVGGKTSSGSKGPCVESHTYVDEAYITSIQEDCHWSRDNGIIELIPIAVVEISHNY